MRANEKLLKRACLFIFAVMTLCGMCKLEANAVKSYSESVPISKKNPVVVIRSSYATGEFDSGTFGGVYVAVGLKDTEYYTLYDVVLWDDRINLYKFEGDVEDLNKDFWDYMNGKYTEQPPTDEVVNEEKIKYREQYCLLSVKCNNKDDGKKSSAIRRKAYKRFFEIIEERTPSKHVVIKYSGHGGGATFCNCMNLSDTKKLLKDGVKIFGQKFAIVDYGTNCMSGMTDVLNMYQEYSDYMIVSQLNVGGWQWDNWDSDKFFEVDEDSQYPNMFRKGEKMKQSAIRIGKQISTQWKYGKKYMRKHKIAQSITVVDMKQYKKLRTQIKKGNNRYAPSDLWQFVKKNGNAKMRKQYNKAIPYYANNKRFLKGKWKYGHGITVNGF